MSLTYGFLLSGDLGFLCLKNLYLNHKILFVLTDKNSSGIIQFCKENKVRCFIGNPRKGRANAFLDGVMVDVIFSINYLFIIEEDIIKLARKHALNIHGSNLPKYRGRTPHVWAIINNEKEVGITVHKITLGCDEGDIAYQEIIPISSEITGGEVLEILKKRYPLIVDVVLTQINNSALTYIHQDEAKATWFGKRTPEDGLINWGWQKERIYNWVRALSRPYPGAFTFYKSAKLSIHKIKYSDNGYRDSDENGLILDVIGSDLIVKTPNGAISVIDYEFDSVKKFQKGDVLL